MCKVRLLTARNKKIVVAFLFSGFMFFLFPTPSFAVSGIEAFIIKHPFLFPLILFGFLAGGAIVFYAIRVAISLKGYKGDKTVEKHKKEIAKEQARPKRGDVLKSVPIGGLASEGAPDAELIIQTGSGITTSRNLVLGEEFNVGRAEGICQLVLSDPTTSREHSKIRPEKEGYVIYDLGSRRGTFVNGRKIQKHLLRNGDRIAIGDAIITFHVKG